MSVRVVQSKRKAGAFEVDVRVRLASGQSIREKKLLTVSRSAAKRWGEERERHLLQHGPDIKNKEVPTLEEFMPRFMDGHARANRQKPSGIAAKETIFRQHLLPLLGSRRLDQITTEQVQRLKLHLGSRSRKTVNNVVSVLNIALKKAVEWNVIERMPCAIHLLPVQKPSARFHDFEEFERLVNAASDNEQARIIVMLGGRAGLRCGEIMALEWGDVDLKAGVLNVARSEWKGNVTEPKGGRSRRVPLAPEVLDTLRGVRHLRGTRVLCGAEGQPFTQKMVQNVMKRVARKARVRQGVHILRHTFCSHLAMRGVPARSIQALAGHEDLATTLGYMHVSPQAIEEAVRVFQVKTA
jgi:integrase